MLFVRRVEQESMLPTLRPGQLVFAWHTRNYSVGDVVVAFVNGKEVIKRISKLERGQVYLESDNTDPTAGATSYGPLPDTRLEAVIVWPRTKRR